MTKEQKKNKIFASYCTPKYRYERIMCGINSFRSQSYPDGFKKEAIFCNSLEELERAVLHRNIAFEHYGPRRTLRMEDLIIKIVED
jgi:hypothetical protein